MNSTKGTVLLLLGLAIVWVFVTSSLQPPELLIGGVVIVVVAIATRTTGAIFGGLRIGVGAILRLPVYLVVFVWELIKANFDVARRVLSPRLPIRPGIVCAQTTLTSRIARLVLANSITLTPGTLTMDVEGDRLIVHWIDVRGQDCDSATKAIVGKFERHIKEIAQ